MEVVELTGGHSARIDRVWRLRRWRWRLYSDTDGFRGEGRAFTRSGAVFAADQFSYEF